MDQDDDEFESIASDFDVYEEVSTLELLGDGAKNFSWGGVHLLGHIQYLRETDARMIFPSFPILEEWIWTRLWEKGADLTPAEAAECCNQIASRVARCDLN